MVTNRTYNRGTRFAPPRLLESNLFDAGVNDSISNINAAGETKEEKIER
jgi:hypothetical protein